MFILKWISFVPDREDIGQFDLWIVSTKITFWKIRKLIIGHREISFALKFVKNKRNQLSSCKDTCLDEVEILFSFFFS